MHRTSQDRSPDASTIVSRSPGKAYERMRRATATHVDLPLSRKLIAAGGLLALLAATFGPSLIGGEVPTAPGPETSAPLVAGLAGGALVGLGALAMAALGGYRVHSEPLTERQALRVVAVEEAATYLGLVTGGLLVVAAAVAVAFDAGAAQTVALPAGGATPASLAVAAGAAAVGAVAAGRVLRVRLPRRR